MMIKSEGLTSSKSRSIRLWSELALGAITAACLLLTLVLPQWIEGIFGVDPDGGAGSTEQLLTISLAVAALALITLLRRDRRAIRKSAG